MVIQHAGKSTIGSEDFSIEHQNLGSSFARIDDRLDVPHDWIAQFSSMWFWDYKPS